MKRFESHCLVTWDRLLTVGIVIPHHVHAWPVATNTTQLWFCQIANGCRTQEKLCFNADCMLSMCNNGEVYTVFHKKWTLFSFFHNSPK